MGVNDLMILDLEKLQEITGDVSRGNGDPTADTLAGEAETLVSLQTETIPDLAKVVADIPELSSPFKPKGGKRQFTLREEAPGRKRYDERLPMARYSGAGVYSMPVRYTGDGKFERGRDNPRSKDPEYKPVVIETSEFELDNVENELRRRGKHSDDE